MASEIVTHQQIEAMRLSIETHERLHELLERRLILVRENYSSKSEYEKNEVEIITIETRAKIDKLITKINDTKFELDTMIQTFLDHQ